MKIRSRAGAAVAAGVVTLAASLAACGGSSAPTAHTDATYCGVAAGAVTSASAEVTAARLTHAGGC